MVISGSNETVTFRKLTRFEATGSAAQFFNLYFEVTSFLVPCLTWWGIWEPTGRLISDGEEPVVALLLWWLSERGTLEQFLGGLWWCSGAAVRSFQPPLFSSASFVLLPAFIRSVPKMNAWGLLFSTSTMAAASPSVGDPSNISWRWMKHKQLVCQFSNR